MKIRFWFLCIYSFFIVYTFIPPLTSVHANQQTDQNLEAYYYIDLFDGLFPIPSSLVLQAISLKPDYTRKIMPYNVSYALPFWDAPVPFINRQKYISTNIQLGLVNEIDPSTPPSPDFSFEESFIVNHIKIDRYRMNESKTDMEGMLLFCIDRIIFRELYVTINSKDCKLSSRLANGFIPRPTSGSSSAKD